MKKLIILLCLMMAGCGVQAGDLVIMGSSYHQVYDQSRYVNNNTYGIGYEGRYFGGLVYKNSIDNVSVMGYAKYDYSRYLSNSIGIASGYEETKIIPLTSLKYKNIRVSSSYPFGKLTDSATDVFNVQYIVKF